MEILVALTIVLLCLYAIAYGQIGRIIGANVTPGDGLVSHVDSTAWHILVGWGAKINNDSLVVNATDLFDSLMGLTTAQTVTGTKTFTSASGVILGADGQDGKLTIFSEQGGTDYSVVFDPHATMTGNVTYTLPPDDGTTDQFLQTNGSGALVWATPSGSGDITDVWDCATGDCNTMTIGESEYLIGGAIDGSTDPYISLPQGADVSSVTGEGRISWDTDGDKLYVGSGASALEIMKKGDVQTEIEDSLDEVLYLEGGTMTGGINMGDQDIFNAERVECDTVVVNTDEIMDFTGTGMSVSAGALGVDLTASFTWTGTHDFTGAAITNASFEEADMNWASTPLDVGAHAVWENTGDSIDVLYPLADGLHSWYLKATNFSGQQPDEHCTTTVTWVVTADMDSIAYDINTEFTVATATGVAIALFKQSKVGGDTTRIYPTSGDPVFEASSTEDTWLHKTIAGGSINAISAGDILTAWMMCRVDTARTAKWSMPYPYVPGK